MHHGYTILSGAATFGKLIHQLLHKRELLTAIATFENNLIDWTPLALGLNKINNRILEYLMSYSKKAGAEESELQAGHHGYKV